VAAIAAERAERQAAARAVPAIASVRARVLILYIAAAPSGRVLKRRREAAESESNTVALTRRTKQERRHHKTAGGSPSPLGGTTPGRPRSLNRQAGHTSGAG